MGSSLGGIFGTFYIIFMAAIVLFLAYVATRLVGSKYMKNLKGKNIRVVESISIGIDKVLYLVKIGNQYFLISASGKNINFLSQVEPFNVIINPEDIQEDNQQLLGIGSFAKYLDYFREKLSKRKSKENYLDGIQGGKEVSTMENKENIERNVEKIRNIFSSVKPPDKDGVE